MASTTSPFWPIIIKYNYSLITRTASQNWHFFSTFLQFGPEPNNFVMVFTIYFSFKINFLMLWLGGRWKHWSLLLAKARGHDHRPPCLQDWPKQSRVGSCRWNRCRHGRRLPRLPPLQPCLCQWAPKPCPPGLNPLFILILLLIFLFHNKLEYVAHTFKWVLIIIYLFINT